MRIVCCVTSDLVTDQRVHRVCQSLNNWGHEVELIGRKRKSSPKLVERSYKTKRLKLIFDKGALFYAEFNLRLFLLLFFRKTDLIWSNDLDTLLACAQVSRMRSKKLIYDSHELFTQVPELINRPSIQKIWSRIEKMSVPKIDAGITVSEGVAIELSELYGIEFDVVRNLPESYDAEQIEISAANKIRESETDKIILYQGSVNVDRGLEEMIKAMKWLKEWRLFIAGDGDVFNDLKNQVKVANLDYQVIFLGRKNLGELRQVTIQADLGISIEKNTGKSYNLALPNKLFDYIQAGIPVLISPLPEMLKIQEHWKVGAVLDSHEPKSIAENIKLLYADKTGLSNIKEQLKLAAAELNWENESNRLKKIIDSIDQAE